MSIAAKDDLEPALVPPPQATSAYHDLPATYRAATVLGESAGVVGVLEFPILQEITEITEEPEN